ncbi:MAG: restriction endonuclease subunit S, partial [Methylomarinum sp.]|nr:restriction endonuclease subunit S [Methylomarinum sp.]
QQLLTGKKRFAKFDREWEKVRLGDIAEINSGGTPKSSVTEYYGGNIAWVSIADMTKHGKWVFKTGKNISQLGLENSSARLYPVNTVLYAMYASIGECSIAKIELTSSQAILGIRVGKGLNHLYLYYFLSSLKDKIKLLGQQGTQANLNAGIVKDFKFKLPTIEEQKKIASVLTAADQEIETLQQKLTHIKQEKKALMQQLLTGNRRVKVDNETEAA